MEKRRDLLLDKRLVDRHLERGLVTEEEYQKHLGELPDLDENAEVLEVEVESVGVETVEKKKTGDE